jgi:hypothetical protein
MDSAIVSLDDFVSGWPSDWGPLLAYGTAVTARWFDLTGDSVVARWRTAAVHGAEAVGDAGLAEVAWLDGVAAAKRGDLAALADARTRLVRSGDPEAIAMDRSLELFERRLANRGSRYGSAVAAVDLATTDRLSVARRPVHVWVTPILRMAAAMWLQEEGASAEAASLLTWHEASSGRGESVDWLSGPIYLERARIDEARGNLAMARRNYTRFLQRFDLPDASLRPLVVNAREAVRRLTASSKAEADIPRVTQH